MKRSAELSGKTLSGEPVSFSYDGYIDAMQRYSLQDIEEVVVRIENGSRRSGITGILEKMGIKRPKTEPVPEEVAVFFRDFAIVQEAEHPDFDRGVAIGSLATRIELALDQVPDEIRTSEFYDDLNSACREYDLIFR
jgi:hypothetical protein